MRKIVLLLCISMSINAVFAGGPLQLKVGVIGLHANTWLVSSDFDYIGTTNTPQLTWSTNLGGVISVYFADRMGVEVEAIFGKYKQEFETKSTILNLATGNYTTEMTKIDVPVLFKLGKLIYFEVGPQFTFISKVEEKSSLGTVESTKNYASNQVYGVAGMGIGLGIPKIVQFEGGLRFGYGFNDLNGDPPAYNSRLNSAFWGFKLSAVHKF